MTHRIPERISAIYTALQHSGIDISLREGLLRFSPHLYNTEDDIDQDVNRGGTVALAKLKGMENFLHGNEAEKDVYQQA